MKLNIEHEEIHFLAEKAFYWPKEKLLGLSDLHVGKAESLQKLGLPIPSGTHLNDLNRLSQLIKFTHAERVFILGDFIHQRSSWAENIQSDLKGFFSTHHYVEWNLLVGNHDKTSIPLLKNFPFKLFDRETQIGPFLFTHGHSKYEGKVFTIQGHIHPVIRIDEGSTKLRLPCFVLRPMSLVIPSFGELTGGYEITPHKKDRIFAVAGKEIFEV